MKIIEVVCAKGLTGFFSDDQAAIKTDAAPDGETYRGQPVTPGFAAIRQAGEAVSVLLVLEDGQIAHGDCAAVQYSGVGGRDPLFLAGPYIDVIQNRVAPLLRNREITGFRALAEEIDRLTDGKSGRPVHTAVRYGVTQAILDAAARSGKMLMAELIAEEYDTRVSDKRVPVFTQSGDSRYDNADKMILKRADVLPHGLINNVGTKLGGHGELLLRYVTWLKNRVEALKPDSDYRPVLHIDVYGTIGLAFKNDYDRIVGYLLELEAAAHPLRLRIEGPVDAGDRAGQMRALRELTRRLTQCEARVQLVADEWCNTLEDIKYFADNGAGHMIQIKTPDLGGINNTIEAVLYCKQKGAGAYLGGTCNETDRSAQICAHIAMATQPEQMLAKPGMGVDEGYMIVCNEMERILAVRKARAVRETHFQKAE